MEKNLRNLLPVRQQTLEFVPSDEWWHQLPLNVRTECERELTALINTVLTSERSQNERRKDR